MPYEFALLQWRFRPPFDLSQGFNLLDLNSSHNTKSGIPLALFVLYAFERDIGSACEDAESGEVWNNPDGKVSRPLR
jgi:hypothetical protein